MLRRFNPEVCQEQLRWYWKYFFKAYERLSRDVEQAQEAYIHMGVHMSDWEQE